MLASAKSARSSAGMLFDRAWSVTLRIVAAQLVDLL